MQFINSLDNISTPHLIIIIVINLKYNIISFTSLLFIHGRYNVVKIITNLPIY